MWKPHLRSHQPMTDDLEPLITECLAIIRAENKASLSLFQRRLRIGFNRALDAMEELERRGVVAPADSASAMRTILNTDLNTEPMSFANTRQNQKQSKKEALVTCPDCGQKNIQSKALAAHQKSKHCQKAPKADESADELIHVPHADIHIEEGFNVRTDFGEDLAPSILEKGIVQPVIGYRSYDPLPSRIMLVEGARRHRDLGRLIAEGKLSPDDPKAQVPFIFRQRYADPLERTKAMLTFGSTGKPLTMSERARGCVRLRDAGLDNVQIAAEVHTTPTAVADCFDLLEIVAPEILACVDRGECASTFALDLARTVPDKAQQWEHYQEGKAKAGEGTRVSAKHLSIPIGKAAGKKRTGLSIQSTESAEPIVCRVCGKNEADDLEARRLAGEPDTLPSGDANIWPERTLCISCAAVPMADVQLDDDTGADHEGRLWKHDKVEVPLPDGCKTKVTLLIVERDGRHRWGYECKWPAIFRPGVPNNKQDGWKKELPSLTGPAADSEPKARLHAAQAARCELEVKDFHSKPEAKPVVLAAMKDYIDSLAAQLGGATHEPQKQEPQQETKTDGQPAPDTSHQPVTSALPASPPEFTELFTILRGLRDHFVDCKGIAATPKYDSGMEKLGTYLETCRREREQAVELKRLFDAMHQERDRALMERDTAQGSWQSIAARIANVEANRDRLEKDVTRLVGELGSAIAEAKRLEAVIEATDTVPRADYEREIGKLQQALDEASHQSPVTSHELTAALSLVGSVIENAPTEEEREPGRVETLQVFKALLEGRLGTPETARQTLMNWIMGVPPAQP